MDRDERIILESEKLRLESRKLIARCEQAKDELDKEIIISESFRQIRQRAKKAEKPKSPDKR